MQVAVDVPDAIYQAIQHGAGRIHLQKRFYLNQYQARYYLRVVAAFQTSPHAFHHRELLLADLHIPEEDPTVLQTILSFGLSHQITGVTILGDGVNFDQFSHWLKNPDAPRFTDVQSHCIEVLQQIRDTFPHATYRYVKGNHEDWVRQYLWKEAKALAGLKGNSVPELLALDGWDYIDTVQRLEDGNPPLELGGYYLLHGHERKVGMGVINIPRIFYEKHFHRPCIVAHYHRSQFWIARAINHTYDLSFSIGCCRTLNPGWSAHNQWNHGCALLCWNDGDRLGILYNKIILQGQTI